jgi:hypothetical protein
MHYCLSVLKQKSLLIVFPWNLKQLHVLSHKVFIQFISIFVMFWVVAECNIQSLLLFLSQETKTVSSKLSVLVILVMSLLPPLAEMSSSSPPRHLGQVKELRLFL